MTMVQLNEVRRWFSAGESRVFALDGISLEIKAGDFVAVTGPSGCGKSTLLNLLGGLDHASEGEIFIDGLALHTAKEKDLTAYRRKLLGIVFQFFNLLPTMTVLENVELPLLLQGIPIPEAKQRALSDLELVGMADRTQHFPHQLSGGQMQRAAIARAIVHRPSLLLADEPTGNLDTANATLILSTLEKIASQGLVTMILVTHSAEIAAVANRQVELLDGKLLANV